MTCSVDPVFASVRFFREATLIAAFRFSDNVCLTNDYNTSEFTGQCTNDTDYIFIIKSVLKQNEGESWICQGVKDDSSTAHSNCITIHVSGDRLP